jgi:hypothetical protein
VASIRNVFDCHIRRARETRQCQLSARPLSLLFHEFAIYHIDIQRNFPQQPLPGRPFDSCTWSTSSMGAVPRTHKVLGGKTMKLIPWLACTQYMPGWRRYTFVTKIGMQTHIGNFTTLLKPHNIGTHLKGIETSFQVVPLFLKSFHFCVLYHFLKFSQNTWSLKG